MAERRTYKCTGCSYTALISGGRDFTMSAETLTHVCSVCKELVDVAIGEYGKKHSLPTPEQEKYFNKCPKCGSGSHLVIWKSKENRCPKCLTGKMKIDRGGLEMIAD